MFGQPRVGALGRAGALFAHEEVWFTSWCAPETTQGQEPQPLPYIWVLHHMMAAAPSGAPRPCLWWEMSEWGVTGRRPCRGL